MIILKNGTVVTGDGKTILDKASVIIKNESIADVTERLDESTEAYAERVIDCTDKAILPGMINHHQHGVTFGPMFASGATPLARERILELLDRNLLQGHTTVLNVDGFATINEIKETQKNHPIKIKGATTHTPLNIEAADKLDGTGLQSEHREMTVEKMLEDGAVAIGEIGGGHTLGGGGQDYLYIPKAIKNRTGRDIETLQARALKLAVLGRYIEKSAYDLEKVSQVLKEIKFDDVLSPEEAKEIVCNTVLPSVQVTLEGYREAAQMALKYKVPMIAHNAPTSMKLVHEIGQMEIQNFIAAHSNYLFTKEEAIENTKKLRQYEGIIIDAAVHDPFGEKKLVSGPENLFAFFENDLADIVSTDYAAGKFDSMLSAFENGIKNKLISLTKAIAMGTKNVIESIPNLADNSGLLSKNKDADILVTAYPEISQVETILINGQIVVEKGKRII